MILEILNILGIIAFSASGALKGLKHHLDIFGVVVLGIITAFGGGMMRDAMLNKVPAALLNETMIYYAVGTAIVAYMLGRRVENFVFVIKFFDAIGLAVFTIVGAQIGIESKLGIFGVMIMGTLTGVAGGVIRDALVGEIPFVLKEEIYAMFCVLGSAVYFLGLKADVNKNILIYGIVLFISVARILAVKYDLHLPKRKIH